MTHTDTVAFIDRLTRLAELLDAPLTAGRIAGYVESLEDLSLDDLLEAMTRAGRECQYFPKPVELRSFAVDAAQSRKAAIRKATTSVRPEPHPPSVEDRARTEEAFQAFLVKARQVIRQHAFPGTAFHED